MNNINKISVQDCFKYFQRNKNINKFEYFKCINCSNNTNFNFTNNLYSTTQYLFISLSYNNAQIQNMQFEISENIDLDNINTTIKYELYGIVGLLNENGKFIAYCKNDKSIKWDYYYDGKVTTINSFNEDIKNKCKPYFLKYKKIKE